MKGLVSCNYNIICVAFVLDLAVFCLMEVVFLSQDYSSAHEDFQNSLELNKNQPIAMLYKGLTFFHRGLLKVIILNNCAISTICVMNAYVYLLLNLYTALWLEVCYH